MTWDQAEIVDEINQETDEKVKSRLFAELSQLGEAGAELLMRLRHQYSEVI